MATLSTTTLASAASASEGLIYVASSSAITSASYICIDREVMNVVAVLAAGVLSVERGETGSQTAHASGSTVYIGSSHDFHTEDPIGPPPATEPGLPWINVETGRHWALVNGAWVQDMPNLQL